MSAECDKGHLSKRETYLAELRTLMLEEDNKHSQVYWRRHERKVEKLIQQINKLYPYYDAEIFREDHHKSRQKP